MLPLRYNSGCCVLPTQCIIITVIGPVIFIAKASLFLLSYLQFLMFFPSTCVGYVHIKVAKDFFFLSWFWNEKKKVTSLFLAFISFFSFGLFLFLTGLQWFCCYIIIIIVVLCCLSISVMDAIFMPHKNLLLLLLFFYIE